MDLWQIIGGKLDRVLKLFVYTGATNPEIHSTWKGSRLSFEILILSFFSCNDNDAAYLYGEPLRPGAFGPSRPRGLKASEAQDNITC